MQDFSSGNIGRQILTFSLPMLAGNVFQQLYNVVDTIIIGRFIGTEALAAAGASFPVIFVLVSLVIGITTGLSVIISQYYGAKDFEKIKRAIDTGIVFLFIASIVLTIFGLAIIGYIWKLLSLPEYLVADATLYFNIYAIGLIFLFGYNGVSSVLRGLGDSKTPLYFLIISTLLNIVLDLLFVLVFGWGIAGVAIATVIAQGVSFVLCVVYLNRYHPIIRVSAVGLGFDREIFRNSLRIGIPTGMQHTFVALGMMALMRLVSGFGTNTIAAYTIAVRIDSFAAIPAMNFGMALSTFVGQNLGANKPERVSAGLKSTLIMSSIVSLAVTSIAWIFGRQIMGIFSADQEVIEIGYQYLTIVSTFYILFSAMFATNGVLRGAGDALMPMLITLFSLWIFRIPSSYFLSLEMGTNGIWWGIPIAWFVGWIFSHLYYKSGKWKNKVIAKPKATLIE
ncbi:MAG TPA: MATE family efflux transporter [Bacteroidales bacterium]|nr:MATE family efflux transporter [Bacteroidales bacterium]